MPVFGFRDSTGADLGTKYVTRQDVMQQLGSQYFGNSRVGSFWAWGTASSGQLGNNQTLTNASSPITPTALAAPPGTQITELVDTSGAYKLMRVMLNQVGSRVSFTQSLYGWGTNEYGQLGDGTTVAKSTMTLITTARSFKKISSYYPHTIAIDESTTVGTAAEVYVWGNNTYGQLGTNNTTNLSTPTAASIATYITGGIADVAAGLWHSLYLDRAGNVFASGRNNYGQLGTNNTTNLSVPTAITAPAGVKFWRIKAGSDSSAGIDTNGVLWTWGANQYGQLGDGTALAFTGRSTPVSVIGGLKWRSVAIGSQASAGITRDGVLYTWGDNASGQLGNGTTTASYSPVTISKGGNSWLKVVSGGTRMFALRGDGSIYSWGLNQNGELGIGSSVASVSTPTIVAGGLKWTDVGYASGISDNINWTEASGITMNF